MAGQQIDGRARADDQSQLAGQGPASVAVGVEGEMLDRDTGGRHDGGGEEHFQ